MGKNLAERYSPEVDESFSVESRAVEIVNEDSAKWDGVETVNVYSMPVAPLHEYDENSLTNVYGTPMILERNLQKMTVKQKPTFSFRIRRLDKNSDMMASEAGQALSRQVSRMVIPQYDHYVFSVAAHEAQANGNAQIGVKPTKNNVYEMFLAGMENLGNAMAPDKGRIAVCSYGFYNLLKQDPAFVKYGDATQKMLSKGIIGDVDGCRIMRVPNSRLPAGASCLITHPYAMCAPKKLQDFIIHDNPPGWNGWAVEGLIAYDAFVLNEKADGIYYIGASGVNKRLQVCTMPSGSSSAKTVVTVMSERDSGNTWKYTTGAAKVVSENGAVPNSEATWTALTANGMEITPTKGSDTIITVVELDSAGKVVGEGYARINMA